DLHLCDRRQRQMCIRDSSVIKNPEYFSTYMQEELKALV
ncbi:DUF1889 family protein, partial [Escherichia coli]